MALPMLLREHDIGLGFWGGGGGRRGLKEKDEAGELDRPFIIKLPVLASNR